MYGQDKNSAVTNLPAGQLLFNKVFVKRLEIKNSDEDSSVATQADVVFRLPNGKMTTNPDIFNNKPIVLLTIILQHSDSSLLSKITINTVSGLIDISTIY